MLPRDGSPIVVPFAEFWIARGEGGGGGGDEVGYTLTAYPLEGTLGGIDVARWTVVPPLEVLVSVLSSEEGRLQVIEDGHSAEVVLGVLDVLGILRAVPGMWLGGAEVGALCRVLILFAQTCSRHPWWDGDAPSPFGSRGVTGDWVEVARVVGVGIEVWGAGLKVDHFGVRWGGGGGDGRVVEALGWLWMCCEQLGIFGRAEEVGEGRGPLARVLEEEDAVVKGIGYLVKEVEGYLSGRGVSRRFVEEAEATKASLFGRVEAGKVLDVHALAVDGVASPELASVFSAETVYTAPREGSMIVGAFDGRSRVREVTVSAPLGKGVRSVRRAVVWVLDELPDSLGVMDAVFSGFTASAWDAWCSNALGRGGGGGEIPTPAAFLEIGEGEYSCSVGVDVVGVYVVVKVVSGVEVQSIQVRGSGGGVDGAEGGVEEVDAVEFGIGWALARVARVFEGGDGWEGWEGSVGWMVRRGRMKVGVESRAVMFMGPIRATHRTREADQIVMRLRLPGATEEGGVEEDVVVGCRGEWLPGRGDKEWEVSFPGGVAGQVARALVNVPSEMLHVSGQAWKVVFEGLGAADAGGPYRESVLLFVRELQDCGVGRVLQRTANAVNGVGNGRSKYEVVPGGLDAGGRGLLYVLGRLIGLSFRSGLVLELDLNRVAWKVIVEEEVGVDDLGEVDLYGARFGCREGDDDGVGSYLEERRVGHGVLVAGVHSVIDRRSLVWMNWKEAELAVAGVAEVDVERIVKDAVVLSPLSRGHPSVQYLWEALATFSQEELGGFLRFVWGRSRLGSAEGRERLSVAQLPSRCGRVECGGCGCMDGELARTATCYFRLIWPWYSGPGVAAERLRVAITCVSIDNV